jgi:hypothetical protein
MKKRLVLGVVLGATLVAIPGAASAGQPSNPDCWGAAARDLAQSDVGAMGDHASSFDSPRLGIGNVAYLFTGTHQPGDLAAALGFECD